jgi:hypothetical protein
MSLDSFNVKQSLELIRKTAWDFVGESRSVADLRPPAFTPQKQLYYLETCVWNLLTMVSAATYHTERILAEMENTRKKLYSPEAVEEVRQLGNDMLRAFLDRFADPSLREEGVPLRVPNSWTGRSPQAFAQKVGMSVESGPVLFEFNAFLAAVRSALDYAARVLSVYIKGTNFHSIHKLYTSLTKNHSQLGMTQFITVEWNHWIGLLKSYRDAVTHNVVLTFSASRELDFDEDTEHPKSDSFEGFYIYREPPRFRYKVIGMEDVFDRELPIIETAVSMTVELPDGQRRVLQSTNKRLDMSQVMPLEVYLVETYHNMQQFIIKLLSMLAEQRGQFVV